LILSRLLQVKYEQDPSLKAVISLALHKPASIVPSLSSHLNLKATSLTSFVNEQIIERLKDRQLVQQVLSVKEEE
jgi:hypothetical protein